MRRCSFRIFKTTFIAASLFSLLALGQNIEKAATYVSEVDDSINIRKVSVLPVVDNVEGIYARAFENEVIASIQNDHKWDYLEAKTIGPVASPYDLENDPTQVMALGKTIGADALIASKISKGPEGISMKMSLFLSNDGKLLITNEQEKIQNFDLKNIQAKAKEMLSNIRSRIPYQGLVLSRSNTRVTVNLGTRDGVKKDQVVNAVQIIKITRHPKFNFLINTEKEILGKIKLRKVEDTLSFGDVISEKEKGAIRRQSKIAGVDFVEYPDVSSIRNEGGAPSDNFTSPGSQLAFGEKPKEWVPVRPASFGLVNLGLGIGNYSANIKPSGTTYSASKPYYPNLKLHGELWFNPEWQVEADMRQGIMTVENPRTGSSPGELNVAISTYALYGAYNWLIRGEFWGPRLTLLAGFKQYSSTVDESSPTVFSTMVYRGLDIGIRGSLPLDNEQLWKAGATFNIMVLPAVQEKPTSSGSSASNTVNAYSILVGRRIGQRLEATGQLEFEYYSSSFGDGGTTASQRITTVYGGISYLF